MAEEITVRPAVMADAPALSELVIAVLYASNLADYGAENVARVAGHFSVEGVKTMLGNRHATFVALQGDRVVGTASLDLDEDGQTAAVKTFFVDARMQRLGIGARLYAHVVAKAAESGIARFTVRSSIAGIPFYERLGFVSVRDHWDGTERTVEMRN
ncbi:GNAT family N-acetyltransferase [Yoonia sp. R2-816]|uniref:GNAT family N-acetyltransferase n=1 Tax=Yoonia sp. R2-816 TaxID=3342638 RepID=UPI0037291EE2